MGALLTSILQGIGRTGGELQEAKTANQMERERRIQSDLQMRELQKRLEQMGVQGQLSTAPQVVHTYKGADGKIHNLIRNPLTGAISDQVASGPGEMTSAQVTKQNFKDLVGRDPTPQEAAILAGINPRPQTEYEREQDRLKADEELRQRNPQMWRELHPPRATSALADTRSVADKARDIQSGTATLKDFPTKERGAIATYMRQNNIKAVPKLTAQESKLNDLMKQVGPKVGQLKKLLEDNKLTEENAWMMGDNSAFMQWLRFEGYKRGVKPEQVHSDLIKAAAALQVMGAAPWMQIGRGKYMFETIVQHLPNPTDTPALLYDKANFLQGIVDEAKQSVPKADSETEKSQSLVPGEEVEE